MLSDGPGVPLWAGWWVVGGDPPCPLGVLKRSLVTPPVEICGDMFTMVVCVCVCMHFWLLLIGDTDRPDLEQHLHLPLAGCPQGNWALWAV